MTEYSGKMPPRGIEGNDPEDVTVKTYKPDYPEKYHTALVIFDEDKRSPKNITLGPECEGLGDLPLLATLATYFFFEPDEETAKLLSPYLEALGL